MLSLFYTSILQGLPHSLHASVESCVIATVSKALCTHWLSDHMKRIQYIDAVVENFKTGKAAVQRAIPLGWSISCVLFRMSPEFIPRMI